MLRGFPSAGGSTGGGVLSTRKKKNAGVSSRRSSSFGEPRRSRYTFKPGADEQGVMRGPGLEQFERVGSYETSREAFRYGIRRENDERARSMKDSAWDGVSF